MILLIGWIVFGIVGVYIIVRDDNYIKVKDLLLYILFTLFGFLTFLVSIGYLMVMSSWLHDLMNKTVFKKKQK